MTWILLKYWIHSTGRLEGYVQHRGGVPKVRILYVKYKILYDHTCMLRMCQLTD
eukprot:COSAG01_NODE_68763_length_263_cov_0.634146_1_plen_53_part_01